MKEKTTNIFPATFPLFAFLVFLPVAGFAQDYYLTNGDDVRQLKVVPHLAADFNNDAYLPTPAERSKILFSMKENSFVRIYRLDASLSPEEEAAIFAQSNALSPVFEGSGGSLRVLAGGVTVFFKQKMEPDVVTTFFENQLGKGIKFQALDWHPRGYILETGSGLVALDVINQIAGQTEVAIDSVLPNWWRDSISVR